jgi:flagellar assembly protein FliH
MEIAREESLAVLKKSDIALHEEWGKKIDLLVQMLQEGSKQISSRVDEAEEEMIALVYEAVSAVLGDALATPKGIRVLVDHLIAQQRSRAQFSVHLNPEDWTMVTQNLETGSAPMPAVQWVSDPKVGLGGVILHHAQGRLDATLDTVMHNLRDTLLRVRATRHQSMPVVADSSTGNESDA